MSYIENKLSARKKRDLIQPHTPSGEMLEGECYVPKNG